ncbi:IPT/TIG domain-containing protein [Paraflavitalea sp. CAU 1676]|uniref:BACON domain-containing protein n=1 Tax=Paraflavitalea sp. CAU 1676 TaxID=3032598 RepID=UPI0023DC483A|nr:IPT/TIG domain-containing protein [Paraflavitalea sp. CAU 1676]MDF2191526.1 IPT/TIG domain-containing protein [Paraflavitalea sp. CAU 1676]
MKSLYLGIVLLLCGLVLHSCRKNDKFKPTLQIDKSTINVTAEAGKAYLQVTSNTDWTITGMPAWLEVNPKTGKGDTRIELSYPVNGNPEARATALTVKAEGVLNSTVEFAQTGTNPSLLADKNTLSVTETGSEETLVITSNVAWTLSSIPSWIVADKTNGLAGITTVKLTIAANATTAPRKSTLSLISSFNGVTPVNIEINQAQPPVTISAFTTFGRGGDEVTIDGTGFSDVKDKNTVTINDKAATVTAATTTRLKVTVPLKAGTGVIKVKVGEREIATLANFNYEWIWMVSDYAGTGIAGVFFNNPTGVAVDTEGTVYVADQNAHAIYKLTPNAGGTATGALFAGDAGLAPGLVDGQGTSARFSLPTKLAVDEAGNVYVADADNNRIRKITKGGLVSTIPITIDRPQGVVVLSNGYIYATEGTNNRVMQITNTNVVSVYAHNNASVPNFQGPMGIATDGTKALYIASNYNNKIGVAYLPKDGGWSWGTLAGTGANGNDNGAGATATFDGPRDIAADQHGNIYVADNANHMIRKININNADVTVSSFGGSSNGQTNGPLMAATFSYPQGITVSKDGTTMYVCDMGSKKIRKIAYQ